MKRQTKPLLVFCCIILSMVMMNLHPLAAENGYVWLEAEEGKVISGDYLLHNNSAASGGFGLQLYTTNTTAASVEFTFQITQENDYTIKILTTAGDVAHLSKFKWKVDNEPYTYCTSVKTSSVYNQGQFNMPVMWYTLKKAELSQGEHKITILTDQKRSFGDFMYHYFDAIAVVPNDWGWTPNGIQKPIPVVKAKTNAIWSEVENSTNVSQTGVLIDQGSVCVLSQQPTGTIYHFPITIKPPSDGEYDIYFLATPAEAEWCSTAYFSVDSGEKSRIADSEFYSIYGAKYVNGQGMGISWQKVGRQTFDAKKHTLTFTYQEPRAADNQFVLGLDAVVLVPSETDIDFSSDNCEKVMAEFLKSAILIEGDLSKVKSDLFLPLSTINGLAINWSSSLSDYLSIGGKVTRPRYDAQDVQVRLTAKCTVTKNDVTEVLEKVFDITVLKEELYEIQSFTLTYDDATEVVGSLVKDKTLIASVKVGDNTQSGQSAVFIMIVYDANGAMVKAVSCSRSLTKELQTMQVSIPLTSPDFMGQLDGYKVDAFLWKDVETMSLIQQAIVTKGN